ncbi:WD40-repeat-containing domain protein [Radiomyces spectabilis]|uniref:WD40-repeat-containing domain protein n=1 Tax=Radiomyces spectabilis TaxID=64574 RepID=UPI00221FBBDA|nr:WD40-repeat-containing domain protein [Radiomyces spectabilis]KAI8379359.1 WD40-repeat-containing domain protein [Radiomyces spectabilis]
MSGASVIPSNSPLPTELLLAIFLHLDGATLATCATVCRHWALVVNHYDDPIWRTMASRDFQKGIRRFWSLQFPDPRIHNDIGSPVAKEKLWRTWQDMYRITRNWYNGNCFGYAPAIVERSQLPPQSFPYAVVGSLQEQTFFTDLTVAASGLIVRSNPTYRNTQGLHSLILQDPRTLEETYFDPILRDVSSSNDIHAIVCQYTHPTSKWLVTGGLDGSVALWNMNTKKLARLWHGHRGRVLCVSMNDKVVVSGGSDSMLRVWDIEDEADAPLLKPTVHPAIHTSRRGTIDISSYLSSRSEWYQGVGEVAANGHLVACAPDASGPILLFSLLTGSLVYELRTIDATFAAAAATATGAEWDPSMEIITAFTKLCMTPFFLLAKGKYIPGQEGPPVYPVAADRSSKPSSGYVTPLSSHASSSPSPPTAQMTPYQLYHYYQSLNASSGSSTHATTAPLSSSSALNCINVWDLQTGKTAFRLAPVFDEPQTNYTITDIRVTPDYSKVLACVELRSSCEEKLYCWDFGGTCVRQDQHTTDVAEAFRVKAVQIDCSRKSHIHGDDAQTRTQRRAGQVIGQSWACFM